MPAETRTEPEYLVLVPYYSNLGYLAETLRSVVGQRDGNWRCVVVDDSPGGEGVVGLVDSLHDARFESVRNPANLGVAGSFDRCFEIATERGAELAMILHADDQLEPGYVERVRLEHARAPDVTCVAVNASVIGADGRPRRSLPDAVKHLLWPRRADRLEGERGLRLLLRGQFFYCPAVSYRVALVPHPAWDPRWDQVMDLDLYGRILLDGGAIALVRDPLFRYRRHAGSMTQINSATLVRTREETEVCRALGEQAAQRGWHRARRAGTLRVSVRLQAAVQAVGLASRGRSREALAAARLAASA
jgi:glycosyltransferase involved in cell wall biosynthesis